MDGSYAMLDIGPDQTPSLPPCRRAGAPGEERKFSVPRVRNRTEKKKKMPKKEESEKEKDKSDESPQS